MFYRNKIKTIPQDIYHYLTPVALAHWICGDGAKTPSGLLLCTDSYSLSEVILLMNVLIIRYQLDCALHGSKEKNNLRIYIKENSMDKLCSIVLPYMVESMQYKLLKNK